MKNNISSTSLMTALYFLGLSMQYSIEQKENDVEEENDTISPEQFECSIKQIESDDSSEDK
jgi:hypothetical protein